MLSQIKKFISSIALVPSVLAFCFVVFTVLLLLIPIEIGKDSLLSNFVITDKKDIQFILTFIIGGVFTLTIFSYTMVMNVLNRNISNYSPRLIPMLLSEKHHQIVLGFSSGTIIYAMLLALDISSDYSGYFPELGASIGIIMSTGCVFLFIYFIHNVSQSIHINHILHDLFERNEDNLKDQNKTHSKAIAGETVFDNYELYMSEKAGYCHQPDFEDLTTYCNLNDIQIDIQIIPGQFVYRGDVIFKYSKAIDKKTAEQLRDFFAIDDAVPLSVHEVGVKHLVEVAIKAMSSAINDPGTASSAIYYLTQLLILRGQHQYFQFRHVQINERISRKIITQNSLVDICFLEMEIYMKDDPLISKLLAESKSRILKSCKDL